MGLDWGLPNDHSWNADDISPWKPLSLPWRFWEGWDKYPYLHWFVSLALYAPYLGWLLVTGGLDPGCLPSITSDEGCFADPWRAPTVLMGISRALSAAMGTGTVAAVYALGMALHADRAAALAAAAVAAVTGVAVMYAHLGNLDVPQTFWFAVSLVFYVRALDRGALRDHVAFGLLAGCALATKEGIVGAYVGACAVLYAVHLRRQHEAGRGWLAASLDRRMLWTAGALLGVYLGVNNAVFNFAGFVEHWRLWLPSGERMEGYAEAGFEGWGPFAREVVRHLRQASGTPLLALCLAGVPYAFWRHPRRRNLLVALLVPLLTYAVLSMGLSRMARVRFMLPIVVVLAVFGGVLAARLLRARPALRPFAALAVAGALAHGLLYSVHLDWLLLRDGRYAGEAWLRAHVPEGAAVATWRDAPGIPRLAWLGYEVVELPRDEAAAARQLADGGPRWLVTSSTYPGPFDGGGDAVLERLRAGWQGYRVTWEGRGGTPLEPWFWSPGGWLDPRVLVLERVAPSEAPHASGCSRTLPGIGPARRR